MKKRNKDILKHTCTLHHGQREDLVGNYAGICVEFRRFLTNLKLLSESHPESCITYKSSSSRRNEKLKHLAYQSYMIHPFSMFTLYWEYFIFVVYSWVFLIHSIFTLRQIWGTKEMYLIQNVIDFIFLVDLLKHFFTGYYDYSTYKTVLQPREVAKHYLTSYFIVDVLAPMSTCYYAAYTLIPQLYNRKLKWTLRIAFNVRIIRLPRCLHALDVFKRHVSLSTLLTRWIRIIYVVLTSVIWCLSLSLRLEYIYEAFSPDYHLAKDAWWGDSFHSVYTALMQMSPRETVFKTPIEVLSQICLVAGGYFFSLFLYAVVMQAMKLFFTNFDPDRELLRNFQQYVNYKALPIALKDRIFQFFAFKLHYQYYNQSNITKMTSALLNEQINVYITQNHIRKVDFFKDLPLDLIRRFVRKLKNEVYLPNDTIVIAGKSGWRMFFIYYGTVAVYSAEGREVCHLQDGAHFGEIALVFNQPRSASVVAVTPCELFTLSRKDYGEAIKLYPEYEKIIREIVAKRLIVMRGTNSLSEHFVN